MKKKYLITLIALFFGVFCVTAGPVRVMLVTGGHNFDSISFFQMFEGMEDIEYEHFVQPHANEAIKNGEAEKFDVLVFYDMWRDISEAERKAYLDLTIQGKPFLFLHHSLCSYQQWDDFEKIVGGKYVQKSENLPEDELSTYRHDVWIDVSVPDADHPVTRGMSDFRLFDEVYGNYRVSSSVKPLLKTDHPESEPVIGWENHFNASTIIFLQPGHGSRTYKSENYRKLVSNAISYLADIQPGDRRDNGIILRVLTYNILHGATMKGDFDLDRIAEVIRSVDSDLVALQEVDFKTDRARNYDLATELGWRLKMAPLFGKAMDYDGGGYGEGILTKMPVISSRIVPLPHSPGNEQRTALEVIVEVAPGDTISFIGTHLEHQRGSGDRVDQVKKINRVFLKNRYPSILVGDLNDVPESEAISILKEYWSDADRGHPGPTYSSVNPQRKIDYILYRPEDLWDVVEHRVICDSVASDHCAVFSKLRLIK